MLRYYDDGDSKSNNELESNKVGFEAVHDFNSAQYFDSLECFIAFLLLFLAINYLLASQLHTHEA